MTDEQPEALRLADQLERMSLSTQWDKKAADELRRLHEENEALRARLAQPDLAEVGEMGVWGEQPEPEENKDDKS